MEPAASPLRLHLDEHFSPAIAQALTERGIDATSTQLAGLLRADDDEQFEFAQRHARVFVTQDRDFATRAARGHRHFGIIYLPGEPRSIGETIRTLTIVAFCMTPDEIRGRIEYM